MEFEWDDAKAARNLAKHGVSFDESSTAFGDPLAATFFDPHHSDEEDRYLTIGRSARGRIVILSHGERGNRTRIISARAATSAERRRYEDGGFP